MSTESFGVRLERAKARRGPVCVGIDPHAALLRSWGLDDDLAGLERFALTAAEAIAPHAAVVKPQSAFFERFGSRGVAVLEQVHRICREAGALVLLDVKRGDIGSTSAAYAEAYLDPASPIAADAITVSPYLGMGSLQPFVDAARAHRAGLFALALTSNPEGPQFQHAHTAEGETVAGTVLRTLREWNAEGDAGSFGAVVGATVDPQGADLNIGGPLLCPGIGAQGGTLDDVRRVFGAAARDVLPSQSRSILSLGPEPAALAAATRRANDEYGVLSVDA